MERSLQAASAVKRGSGTARLALACGVTSQMFNAKQERLDTMQERLATAHPSALAK
jgi:hypothetical protein